MNINSVFAAAVRSAVFVSNRETTREVNHWQDTPVKILQDTYTLPTEYTNAGKVAKRQPAPINPGDTAYVRLNTDTGEVLLLPFPMAGKGYALVTDAIEGTHYEFV